MWKPWRWWVVYLLPVQAVRNTHRYYSTQTIKYVPRVLHDFTTRASSFILTHFLFEKFEKFNFSGLFLVFSFQMSTSSHCKKCQNIFARSKFYSKFVALFVSFLFVLSQLCRSTAGNNDLKSGHNRGDVNNLRS